MNNINLNLGLNEIAYNNINLRLLFGLGKEENRIYEALIGKITLSIFTYNILSYINRIKHEPQTLGELFRDLECELETLAISMQLFFQKINLY